MARKSGDLISPAITTGIVIHGRAVTLYFYYEQTCPPGSVGSVHQGWSVYGTLIISIRKGYARRQNNIWMVSGETGKWTVFYSSLLCGNHDFFLYRLSAVCTRQAGRGGVCGSTAWPGPDMQFHEDHGKSPCSGRLPDC